MLKPRRVEKILEYRYFLARNAYKLSILVLVLEKYRARAESDV